MKKLTIGLLALAMAAGTQAQPSRAELEGAKFAILKKTVEFLSNDTAFKKVQSHTCDGCKTVADLKKFTAANNLTNADSKVIMPLANTPVDTAAGKWQQSLQNFEQAAINQITGGEKAYRKNLDGYDDYVAAVDAVVTNVSPAKNDKTPAGNDTAVPAATADNKAGIVANSTTPASSLTTSMLNYLPYILALGLFVAFMFVFLENRKLKTGKEHYKKRAHGFEIDLQQRAQTIAALTAEKEKLAKELSDSELDRKSLEDRLRSLEEKKLQPPQAAIPTAAPAAVPVAAAKPASKPQPQPPKQPATKTKYARYADTGDGFSAAELLDKPDGETIFEITIAANNNTGEYKVASNPDAQHYALSNAQYFLGKTCQYDAFPSGNNAVINTEKPGTIKLTGNKWTIVNPAKISFS